MNRSQRQSANRAVVLIGLIIVAEVAGFLLVAYLAMRVAEAMWGR